MTRKEKLGFIAAFVVIAVMFFGIGVALTASFNKVSMAEGAGHDPAASVQPNEFLTQTQESFREIVAAVSPAVCTVKVVTRVSAPPNHGFDFGPMSPFFGPFGGPQQQSPPQQQQMEVPSSGSGFVVSPEGYILTNNHVVADGDEIKVILDSDKEYDAEVVGLDPETDVAVLKINADHPLPYIGLGDSDEIMVGDWVMALGNPFGYLDHSVTVGVISAKNRERITGAQYENFLQTDAAINFGNSGGPLVDIYGKVVGINTAISAQGSGIGFAVPINMAKGVYEDYINYGEVRRGWVGVTIETITDDKAKELALDDTSGALVKSVSAGDPADQAGVKANDFIIRIDGKKMASASEVSRVIAGKEIGQPFEMTVLREGKEVNLNVTPTKREKEAIIHDGENIADIKELGLSIRDFNGEIRTELKVPDTLTGVIITKVSQNSAAERKGLKAGVVITKIDDIAVGSVEQFISTFKTLKEKSSVILDVTYIMSDGSTDSDVIALKIK